MFNIKVSAEEVNAHIIIFFITRLIDQNVDTNDVLRQKRFD
jgi:hypothetical protein